MRLPLLLYKFGLHQSTSHQNPAIIKKKNPVSYMQHGNVISGKFYLLAFPKMKWAFLSETPHALSHTQVQL